MKIVIKIGGSVIDKGIPETLIEDFSALRAHSICVIHGGGKTVTRISRLMGVEPKFITSPSGIRSRFTDEEAMDIYKMVMIGKINSDIVLALNRSRIPAFGFSGLDGPTIFANRKKKLIVLDGRDRKMVIDGGMTGQVSKVDTFFISNFLDRGVIPVISPIAMSEEQEPLNIDADRAAASVAAALNADKLIMITDVDGLIRNGSVVNKARAEEIKEISGEVGNGMDKKLIFATQALNEGVKEIVISNGYIDKPLQNALNGKRRTVILK